MTGQRGSEKRERNKTLIARVTDSEKAEAVRRADEAGLSEGDYIRMQCLQTEPLKRRRRKPTLDKQLLSQLLRHLGHIGGNINQIALKLNTGQGAPPSEIQQAVKDIQEIKQQAQRALDL